MFIIFAIYSQIQVSACEQNGDRQLTAMSESAILERNIPHGLYCENSLGERYRDIPLITDVVADR